MDAYYTRPVNIQPQQMEASFKGTLHLSDFRAENGQILLSNFTIKFSSMIPDIARKFLLSH